MLDLIQVPFSYEMSLSNTVPTTSRVAVRPHRQNVATVFPRMAKGLEFESSLVVPKPSSESSDVHRYVMQQILYHFISFVCLLKLVNEVDCLEEDDTVHRSFIAKAST